MSASPAIDVVITNWNSGDLLRGCIEALQASTAAAALRVIVVDNASSDDSLSGLSDGLRLEVLRNPVNLGFGAACNQGAARGEAPLILFLNPDTRVAPETLERAIARMSDPASSGIGVLGVRLTDERGETQRTCARAPSLGRLIGQNVGLERIAPGLVAPHFMVEWDHCDTRPVDQVMGAFLLIRRPLFQAIGGFDERYFVYYEDVDLCLSARRAGADVVHFAEASAWHKGGGTTDQVKDRRLFYILQSQVLYADKWFGRAAALLVLASALGLHVPLRALRSLAALSPRGAREALGGGTLLLRAVPHLLRRLGARAAPIAVKGKVR
ncbi:MAG TPA: glycosyltransferase family 2 protein [Microvirga sp.]|jgi:GT2 family glycosyltransferase